MTNKKTLLQHPPPKVVEEIYNHLLEKWKKTHGVAFNRYCIEEAITLAYQRGMGDAIKAKITEIDKWIDCMGTESEKNYLKDGIREIFGWET